MRLMAAADALRDSKNWTGARDTYARVVEYSPLEHSAWVQYGHALKESGDRTKALAAYLQALSLKPNVADTQVQLGHVLKQLGQVAGAVAAYQRALQLDASRQDANQELALLGHDPAFEGIEQFVAELEAELKVPNGMRSGQAIVFEVSDLVDYFVVNDRPSGIQRVQIELIRAAQIEARSYPFVSFRNHSADWVELRAGLLKLIVLSLVGSRDALPADVAAIRRFVQFQLISNQAFEFIPDDILVPLGATWGHPQHLSCVSSLKQKFGIFYLPLVYDLSPIFAAHFSPYDRREAFEIWLINALELADFWICASISTKQALEAAANKFGCRQPQSQVVRFDGALTSVRNSKEPSKDLFAAFNLVPGGYVLFVSTIEPRKNHIGAFKAWRTLLDERSPGVPLPKLVCAGKLGWMFEDVLQVLERDPALADYIVMIHSASDEMLDALYRNCICTLYPSRYEGWGLPVTESLCHGKVPVCSCATSLPEAGQCFAVYFDPDQKGALSVVLSRVIYDATFRESREAKIRSDFHARPWRGIYDDIVAIASAI